MKKGTETQIKTTIKRTEKVRDVLGVVDVNPVDVLTHDGTRCGRYCGLCKAFNDLPRDFRSYCYNMGITGHQKYATPIVNDFPESWKTDLVRVMTRDVYPLKRMVI